MQPPDSHIHRVPSGWHSEETTTGTEIPPREEKSGHNRRYKQYQLDASKFIKNLSDFQLTPAHISLLQKGLSFVPTPANTNHIHTLKDTLLFNRRIRLSHFFQNHPPYSPNSVFPSDKKGWTLPSDIDPDIDSFTNYVLAKMSQRPSKTQHRSNLSDAELLALRQLQKDDTIIIKPADKGGATVIWTTTAYENEALRQLNNCNHYRRTTSDLTPHHHRRITNRLKELSQLGILPENAEKTMIHPQPRTSPFYLLPKIHKKDIPGRPIVSGIDCPTDKISHTVDMILRPLVKDIPSYIKDTRDFINLIQGIGHLHDDEYLVTIDVSSLYTNIPHEEGLAALKKALNAKPSHHIPTDTVVELAEMTLKMNTFIFNHRYYHQQQGTAMGTKMAPSYANIFMGDLEEKLLNQTELKPTIWRRYIDDIFAIYRASEDEIHQHIRHLNNLHPTIKFTAEIHHNSIDFLDVTVYRGPNNELHTKVFIKPTNSGQYLHATSHHPKHQIQSIAYSQAIRLRTICSDLHNYDSACKILLKNLTLCGHRHSSVKETIIRARNTDRALLLQPPLNQKKKIIPFTVTFTPENTRTQKVLYEASSFLRPTPANKKFLEYRRMIAYRRPPNLRDLLVFSEHPKPNKKSGCRPCMSSTCNYCKYFTTSQYIKSTSSGKRWPIIGNNSCESFHVIYVITCPLCHFQYVGQTGRNIRRRLYEHLRDIRIHDRLQPVANHFLHHDILPEDLIITVVDNSAKDRNSRLRLEEAWIRILDTITPSGINLNY